MMTETFATQLQQYFKNIRHYGKQTRAVNLRVFAVYPIPEPKNPKHQTLGASAASARFCQVRPDHTS